jgi:DNA-binding NarL/FixJ family response regulator
MPEEKAPLEAPEEVVHRILIVDDRPELRAVLRARLEFEPDLEVVGEGSNGREAVQLARALAPSAVVLDLEMPVMRGDEAIPLLREAAPGMGILLYTGAADATLSEEQAPDATVRKGVSMRVVLAALRTLLESEPFDVMRLEVGTLPLEQAITAFDTWTGLNARVLHALETGEELTENQLSGATPVQLEALMGVYAHLGSNLQKAARAGKNTVTPVIHVFRSSGVNARGALLAFNNHRLEGFWEAWGYEVPEDAVSALELMRDRLMKVLPASSGDADQEPTDA